MNNSAHTIQTILAVPLDQPERLFHGDGGALKREWRKLVACWHPDHHPGEPLATEVLQHINALYEAAVAKLAADEWEGPGVLKLLDTGGRGHELPYLCMRGFELGKSYVGVGCAAFAVEQENRDLFDNAVRTIGSFHYADSAMKTEFTRALPICDAAIETPDQLVLIVRRKADMIALSDLIDHLGGRLDAKHAAWIVSGLANLACYLEWAGLMHGAIAPETVFVSPKHHSVALLGGWWYAARIGETLRALPQRTLELMPPVVADEKRAAAVIDAELIRQLAREVLGDPGGTKLLRHKTVPSAFAKWIAHPPAGSAFADYARWEKAREASFGARKFVELPVKAGDIYR